MKRLIPALALAIVLCAVSSCNEKPRHYTFVQNMSDGKQVVETLDAKNDTVALNMYVDRMSKVIVEAMTDTAANKAQIESMYVISPEGDTLNTNKELMHVIEQQILEKSSNGFMAVPAVKKPEQD